MPKAAVSFVVQQLSRSPLTPLTPLWLYLCTSPIHSSSPPHFTARRPAPFHDSLSSSPPPLTPAKPLTWGIPFLLSHFSNLPPQLSVSSLAHYWTFRFLKTCSRSNPAITNFFDRLSAISRGLPPPSSPSPSLAVLLIYPQPLLCLLPISSSMNILLSTQ